jgi:hypothetical protein
LVTIIAKTPTTCPLAVGMVTRCGMPGTVIFHLGSEIVIVRCESHAEGFRFALRSLLRPGTWKEEHVLLAVASA